MKVLDFPQGSPEWLSSRAGKVTASRIKDVIASGRGGAPSMTRAAYLGEIVAEMLTGKPAGDAYVNADMQRGTELEPEARALYEQRKRVMVDETGLVIHPYIDRAGASPDGLVNDDGLLEIKCPRVHVHLGYLMDGKPPAVYLPQMAWQAACCERSWVDFVSYCPALPDDLALFVVRYMPEDAYIKTLETAVREFLNEADAMLEAVAKLRAA